MAGEAKEAAGEPGRWRCPPHRSPARTVCSVPPPQGADHLVLADQACRNTVFNAQAQARAAPAPMLRGMGGPAGAPVLRQHVPCCGCSPPTPPPHPHPVPQSGLPYLQGLVDSGIGAFRVELVDEPAEHVASLLEGYRAALEAAAQGRYHFSAASDPLWRLLQRLPDAYGRAQGVGLGSLEVRAERSVAAMKPTAASRR